MADHRCRLCTTNDRDALRDELAAELWNRRDLDDWPWERAGAYWQATFRALADDAMDILMRDHRH